jgi:hypothetical protein
VPEVDSAVPTRRGLAFDARPASGKGVVIAVFALLDLLISARRRLANAVFAGSIALGPFVRSHEIGTAGERLVSPTHDLTGVRRRAFSHDLGALTGARIAQVPVGARRARLPLLAVASETLSGRGILTCNLTGY